MACELLCVSSNKNLDIFLVGNKKGKRRTVISFNATIPALFHAWCRGANTLSLQISLSWRFGTRRIIPLRNINFVGINHDQFERLFRVNHRHVSVLKLQLATPSIAFVSAIGPQMESVEMNSIDADLRCIMFLFLCVSLTSDVLWRSKKLSALCWEWQLISPHFWAKFYVITLVSDSNIVACKTNLAWKWLHKLLHLSSAYLTLLFIIDTSECRKIIVFRFL